MRGDAFRRPRGSGAWASATAVVFLVAADASAGPCDDEWYAFVDGQIALNVSRDAGGVCDTDPHFLTTPIDPSPSDGQFYKPIPSPDGTQIGLFRLIDGSGPAFTWETRIAVMNADGSDYRELTDGTHTDVNPAWTRREHDGSHRIVWTRIEPSLPALDVAFGFPFPLGMNTYWTRPDANPGDEEQVSFRGVEPFTFYEFVYSGLEDGRHLVRSEGFDQYYLMTPAPHTHGIALYEPIVYPNPRTLLHKMTISPSETKIAYMKVANAEPFAIARGPDPRSVIAYSDFDPLTRVMSNEVEITELDPTNRTWYPSWSPDEGRLIYACSGNCPDPDDPGNGQIYEYDLATKATRRVSGDLEREYRYPAFRGVVK